MFFSRVPQLCIYFAPPNLLPIVPPSTNRWHLLIIIIIMIMIRYYSGFTVHEVGKRNAYWLSLFLCVILYSICEQHTWKYVQSSFREDINASGPAVNHFWFIVTCRHTWYPVPQCPFKWVQKGLKFMMSQNVLVPDNLCLFCVSLTYNGKKQALPLKTTWKQHGKTVYPWLWGGFYS